MTASSQANMVGTTRGFHFSFKESGHRGIRPSGTAPEEKEAQTCNQLLINLTPHPHPYPSLTLFVERKGG